MKSADFFCVTYLQRKQESVKMVTEWCKVVQNATKRNGNGRKHLRRKEGGRMLQGEYKHSLDAKSRLVAPSKLREELGARFYITKGFDQCLYIFPEESWLKFVQKINGLPGSQEKVRRVQRRFIGSSQECEPDKQGRFLIPANLREYAQITKEVVLVGLYDKIEVWSQDKWNEYCEEDESIDDVAGDLVF